MASSGGGVPQSAIRITLLLVKLPTLSEDEFLDYWQNVHAPLFYNLPIAKAKCLKFQQFHIKHKYYENLPIPTAPYDGEVNMWFASMEDLEAVLSDPEYQQQVVADAVNFSVPEEGRLMLGVDVDFKL